MTASSFRKIALALDGVVEKQHMAHPDFRVGGKIFASLGPDPDRAMVRLPPEVQEQLVRQSPETFQPATGAWGRDGCTTIKLKLAKVAIVRAALTRAWRQRLSPNVVGRRRFGVSTKKSAAKKSVGKTSPAVRRRAFGG